MARTRGSQDTRRRRDNENLSERLRSSTLLSTGSTLLNIACSGGPAGAIIPGFYYLVIGDSSAGKTFLNTSIMAECAYNPAFDKYDVYNDDAEHGNNINIHKLFGKRAADRIKAPRLDEEGEPLYSEYVEDFYDNLNHALDEAEANDRAVLYVLDSMDVLTSKQEEKKDQEQEEARKKGTKTAGSYGDGKAKYNSSHLRQVIPRLRKTGSILLIVCQTRDNISVMGGTKTRSGGRALKFYATYEFWLSRVSTETRQILGKQRQIGMVSKVQVKKNRLTGQEPAVEYPIYYSYGIDDICSMIRYLCDEKVWKKVKSRIMLPEDSLIDSGSEDAVIAQVENDVAVRNWLIREVKSRWKEVAQKSELKRRPKYERSEVDI